MAPERWRAEAPTGAIDVWAFGVTLHELITGERPIDDATLAALPFAPVGLPACSQRGMVADCLALDPEVRPRASVAVVESRDRHRPA
jgi:serine/threonine protein kinase